MVVHMSKLKPLIALVATAVVIDGERQVIEPGQPLPDFEPKEREELLSTRVAREVEEVAPAPAPAEDEAKPTAAAKSTRPKR